MDGTINFIPKMNRDQLMRGYKRILDTIYAHKNYYKRIETFLREYRLPEKSAVKITFQQIKALARSVLVLGVIEKGRLFFWGFMIRSIIRYPRKFQLAITMAVYGFHFRRIVAAV
jgi:hypothetical protein